ncbi:MAG: 23S rRNA (uracil(1939)-C(5))-methyltransferase RlmD [Eubacteriaceae bacterium]|jgi:23S rRNA (uracil-5-)-methyltransferase RumA|nr:23S rRNA (uracil(1939)-C(5))-methyltransferase RlmD [Eubacteriaceae bacterium]
MKKGDRLEMQLVEHRFPGEVTAQATIDEKNIKMTLKEGLPGQRVLVEITGKRKRKYFGKIIEVLEEAPNQVPVDCPVFGRCGGCRYLNLNYKRQLSLKSEYVKKLIDEVTAEDYNFMPILPSPVQYHYRNKMEYTFGDQEKDGPLSLGFHEKGSIFNIVPAEACEIGDEDFNTIVAYTRHHFKNTPYYHRRNHRGILRNLVVRKGEHSGELMVLLVTTSQGDCDTTGWVEGLLNLKLKGRLRGILHTQNDTLGDVVLDEGTILLWGEAKMVDNIGDLQFDITPFSFFQTNTLGAEELYNVVRRLAGEEKRQNIFDLYCGTGTIAQIMADKAEHVWGIELVEAAVEAAQRNAQINGRTNCTFIVGDVLEKIETLDVIPDLVILDPPRDGIHSKAIFKILAFKPKDFIYVSCKATSLARDLPFFYHGGYRLKEVQCVDMFPHTSHVETVALLSRCKE